MIIPAWIDDSEPDVVIKSENIHRLMTYDEYEASLQKENTLAFPLEFTQQSTPTKVRRPRVDDWIPAEEDKIFKTVKGRIIVPFNEIYNLNGVDPQLDSFSLSVKRSYNNPVMREHICRYLNYFEKYFDVNHKLIRYYFTIKTNIDHVQSYNLNNLITDILTYIIYDKDLTLFVDYFVESNYILKLSSNGNKTPALQFEARHVKLLCKISLYMNMYIPLISQFLKVKRPESTKQVSKDISEIIMHLYDACVTKYINKEGIDIHNKLYETVLAIVNKSRSADKLLWDKNKIRGNSPTTHITDSINDIILQISPKFVFNKDIISFIHYSGRQSTCFKITTVEYEYNFQPLSSSKRDADQNSEFDKYEAHLDKKDESIAIFNAVSANDAVKIICSRYGTGITEKEVDFYIDTLNQNQRLIDKNIQFKMITYLYAKYFGDPITIYSITKREYVKLLICARDALLKRNNKLLPYIISSKIVYSSTKKSISNREKAKIESMDQYQQICNKYIIKESAIQDMYELISNVITSKFMLIDYDREHQCAGPRHGAMLPNDADATDLLITELMDFIIEI